MRSKRLDPCVVDTNVAMVANGKSTAGAKCMEACAKKLQEIVESGGHRTYLPRRGRAISQRRDGKHRVGNADADDREAGTRMFEFDYNRGVIPTGGVLHATQGILASGLLLPVAGADQKGHRQPASRHVEGTGCFRSERENRGGTRV